MDTTIRPSKSTSTKQSIFGDKPIAGGGYNLLRNVFTEPRTPDQPGKPVWEYDARLKLLVQRDPDGKITALATGTLDKPQPVTLDEIKKNAPDRYAEITKVIDSETAKTTDAQDQQTPQQAPEDTMLGGAQSYDPILNRGDTINTEAVSQQNGTPGVNIGNRFISVDDINHLPPNDLAKVFETVFGRPMDPNQRALERGKLLHALEGRQQ